MNFGNEEFNVHAGQIYQAIVKATNDKRNVVCINGAQNWLLNDANAYDTDNRHPSFKGSRIITHNILTAQFGNYVESPVKVTLADDTFTVSQNTLTLHNNALLGTLAINIATLTIGSGTNEYPIATLNKGIPISPVSYIMAFDQVRHTILGHVKLYGATSQYPGRIALVTTAASTTHNTLNISINEVVGTRSGSAY